MSLPRDAMASVLRMKFSSSTRRGGGPERGRERKVVVRPSFVRRWAVRLYIPQGIRLSPYLSFALPYATRCALSATVYVFATSTLLAAAGVSGGGGGASAAAVGSALVLKDGLGALGAALGASLLSAGPGSKEREREREREKGTPPSPSLSLSDPP